MQAVRAIIRLTRNNYVRVVKCEDMSAVDTWVVKVYDEDDAVIAQWHIEDRTEREAEREAMADVEREYPGCDWTLTASTRRMDRRNRMEAAELVNDLLEADPDPERYIAQLPGNFDILDVLERIKNECAYCMDNPQDKAAFLDWLAANENLFPDVAKAQEVIIDNDSWCTDSDEDMLAFFARLGYQLTDKTCPKCNGSGEEPGAPLDWDEAGDGLVAVCDRCNGTGQLSSHEP